MGSNISSTHVTIKGSGFDPTPIAALYGGGPYIKGSCDTPNSAFGIYVSHPYAYVADGKSGLQIIDVSNPNTPTIVGSCDTLTYARGAHV